MKVKPNQLVGLQERTNHGRFCGFKRVLVLHRPIDPDWDYVNGKYRENKKRDKAWVVTNDFTPRHIELKCRSCFMAWESQFRKIKND